MFRIFFQNLIHIIISLILYVCFRILPADFGNYLRQGSFKYIFLYGPRKTVKCKLLLRNHPKKSSKIGSGWKEFCTAHGFHQTIDLVFEVDHMKSNQNVKVLTYCNF